MRYSSNAKYWIWFTQAIGYNTPKAKMVKAAYSNIKDFYSDGAAQWLLLGFFTAKELDSLESTKLETTEIILQKCDELGYNVITIADEIYPERLLDIYAPPAVLYVSGGLPDFSALTVSIVGTRKASSYGIKNAFEIAYGLSKAGAVIVSGGALGVDSAAHSGALQCNGITVAVLGCGINFKYLQSNASMRRAIEKSGALISEYPPDYPANSYNFPERNRIISALCNGVLVVEAGKRSGSLITVGFALEQGKDVFAVMANVTSEESKGSNKLIKEGAVPVTDYTDILGYYFIDFSEEKAFDLSNFEEHMNNVPRKNPVGFSGFRERTSRKKTSTIDPPKPTFEKKHREDLELSPIAEKIYKALNNEPLHIDDIVAQLEIPVLQVLQGLTELELLGVIESLKGRCYKLN